MATPTKEQIQKLLDMGITPDQIKKYSQGTLIPPQQQKKEYSGIGSSVINFGKDIAQSGYLMFGGQKKIDQLSKQYLENGDKLFQLAQKQTDKEKKKSLLLQAQSMYNDAERVGGEILGQVRTNKQIIGDALGTLGWTTAGFGGATKGITGLTKELPTTVKAATKAVGIGKGIIQGAKTGAITGGIYGGVGGLQQGLSEDRSTPGLVKGTIGGAVGGAITGGAVGGIVGGISGGIQNKIINKAQKEKQFAEELVMPKATDKIKQQALRERRVTEQGLLKGSKILPSKRDIETAEAVKGLVSSNKSIIQNIDSISNKVDDVNSGVKAYISVNKKPFNTAQLKTQLDKGKDGLKLVFASDTNSKKTYDAVVSEFIKHVNKKDTEGLFLARQGFDKIPAIKKLLDSRTLGENAKKEIVLTVRDMANQYISNLLPKGNLYREALKNETKMLRAITNISEKNSGTIGKSKLIELVNKYPVIKWLVGGLVGGASVGVGGAIIGSTD